MLSFVTAVRRGSNCRSVLSRPSSGSPGTTPSVHSSISELAVTALSVPRDESGRDDHARLTKLVVSSQSIEDFQTLTKALHNLARVLAVTLPKVNFVTRLVPQGRSTGDDLRLDVPLSTGLP